MINYSLCETVADIAYMAGAKRYHTGDSRADVLTFIKWAQEFEASYKEEDENYMDAIEAFAAEKLGSGGMAIRDMSLRDRLCSLLAHANRLGEQVQELNEANEKWKRIAAAQHEQLQLLDYVASMWDSQSESNVICGHTIPNVTGSFMDAIKAYRASRGLEVA